ncbi:Thaumatin-like protein 1a [Dorcoceras hygrometricum]|uniref:Thaumatin-like protein 1a n=1 Tax=Dorcoceras hygrometricum TaxID=472368 RepID=A0A2Z7A8L5_9LAMI|nr:Thaumatin-like protein 1a [Dorcoceras hygrometricum]
MPAMFTVKNNCPYTIWPATLSSRYIEYETGFELGSQASKTFHAPDGWSGRIWARSSCSNSGGRFHCLTGDCGSGEVYCRGAGGTPPVSLVEFTLNGDGNKDFYDLSLVDGFNLPVAVAPQSNNCPTAICPIDINNNGCPNELAVRDGSGGMVGCKSACFSFSQPQYCCTGEYNNPEKCKPTNFSEIFKQRCPQAYSYAYDDKSSLFTCPTGGNYLITFCP